MTEQPNVVRDYLIGNTRIKIADNYCSGMSEEDVKKAIQNIARKACENMASGSGNF